MVPFYSNVDRRTVQRRARIQSTAVTWISYDSLTLKGTLGGVPLFSLFSIISIKALDMEEIIYNVVLKYWYDVTVLDNGGISGEFCDFNISDVQPTLEDLQHILELKLRNRLASTKHGAHFTAPHLEPDSEAGGYITVVVKLGFPTEFKVGDLDPFVLE